MKSPTPHPTLTYARAQRAAYLEQFIELLRIPSISTDPLHQADIWRTAEWIVDEATRIGFQNCRAIPTEGHPAVYGEWLDAGADKPTILVYAHYDVQPVDPLELWESPPFEPTIRDGKLYARGVIDDKCGVFVNLKAFEALLVTLGKLPVNVKLFFEGEEESGSPSMKSFIIANKALLQADVLLISDGGSPPDQPQMFTSVRGIVAGEVTVTGPSHDLHSGSFGGVVHNPTHVVGKMIAALHDDDGRVQIAGFYDDVQPLDSAEMARVQEQEAVTAPIMQERAGVSKLWGVPNYSVIERATAQPTCDVNGIYGGYAGVGTKTIIPASAGFKVSMRLVADQDPEDIANKFKAFIEQFACETVEIAVTMRGEGPPAQLLTEGPIIDAIVEAIERTWGVPPTLYRQGGSVPIMGMMQRELGMSLATLGFGTGDNGHSPNEYYILEYFYRAIETAIHFYLLAGESDGI